MVRGPIAWSEAPPRALGSNGWRAASARIENLVMPLPRMLCCPMLALRKKLNISRIKAGHLIRGGDRHDNIAEEPLDARWPTLRERILLQAETRNRNGRPCRSTQ